MVALLGIGDLVGLVVHWVVKIGRARKHGGWSLALGLHYPDVSSVGRLLHLRVWQVVVGDCIGRPCHGVGSCSGLTHCSWIEVVVGRRELACLEVSCLPVATLDVINWHIYLTVGSPQVWLLWHLRHLKPGSNISCRVWVTVLMSLVTHGLILDYNVATLWEIEICLFIWLNFWFFVFLRRLDEVFVHGLTSTVHDFLFSHGSVHHESSMVRVVALLVDYGDRHLLCSIKIVVIEVSQIVQIHNLVHDYILSSSWVWLVQCLSFISIHLSHWSLQSLHNYAILAWVLLSLLYLCNIIAFRVQSFVVGLLILYHVVRWLRHGLMMLVAGPVWLSVMWLVLIHAMVKEMVRISLLCLVSLHLILLEFSPFLICQLSIKVLKVVLHIVLLQLGCPVCHQLCFIAFSACTFLDGWAVKLCEMPRSCQLVGCLLSWTFIIHMFQTTMVASWWSRLIRCKLVVKYIA